MEKFGVNNVKSIQGQEANFDRRLFTWMGSNFQSLRRTDATTCVAQREWVPCLSEKILIRRAQQ